jgi:hypothetical protein
MVCSFNLVERSSFDSFRLVRQEVVARATMGFLSGNNFLFEVVVI